MPHPLLSVQVNETVMATVPLNPKVRYIDDNSLAVGVDKVVHNGTPGKAREKLRLRFVNGRLMTKTVLSKKVLRQSVTQVEDRGTNTGIESGSWVWPSPYTDITSGFGWRILFGSPNFHPGYDIGCPIGIPIYATNNGVVEQAGWNSGGYGIWVLINNGNGIQTVFGHLSRVAVSPGQVIAKGQVIGYSGDTGDSTGPHLHYEVRVNGTAVNPGPYM